MTPRIAGDADPAPGVSSPEYRRLRKEVASASEASLAAPAEIADSIALDLRAAIERFDAVARRLRNDLKKGGDMRRQRLAVTKLANDGFRDRPTTGERPKFGPIAADHLGLNEGQLMPRWRPQADGRLSTKVS